MPVLSPDSAEGAGETAGAVGAKRHKRTEVGPPQIMRQTANSQLTIDCPRARMRDIPQSNKLASAPRCAPGRHWSARRWSSAACGGGCIAAARRAGRACAGGYGDRDRTGRACASGGAGGTVAAAGHQRDRRDRPHESRAGAALPVRDRAGRGAQRYQSRIRPRFRPRGPRGSACGTLLCRLTGAAAAVVVNNNKPRPR